MKIPKFNGFTIIELTVTITIMGILLALTVVNLNSTQLNARDSKRKNDISTIQSNLEAYYRSGVQPSTEVYKYPSTELLASGETSLTTFLTSIDTSSAIAPGASSVAASFIVATNNNQTTGGVTPQPTSSQYVYQPLQANGSLCTSEAQKCRKFNLYYRLEADNTIYKATSSNQ